MAGLPCAVVALLGFALLGTIVNGALRYECGNPKIPNVKKVPEKCDGTIETGSEMSNEERQASADAINFYRALFAKGCDKFKSGKPRPAGFFKVHYSCDLEKQVKFDCPAKTDKFESSGTTFRKMATKQQTSILHRIAPSIDKVEFDGFAVKDMKVPGVDAMLFYIQDAFEIGCYLKTCHGKEYIACTDSLEAQKTASTQIHFDGCTSDLDCHFRGHYRCDLDLGLCDKGHDLYKCANPGVRGMIPVPDACENLENAGSPSESDNVVRLMNLYRGMVANECDKWGLKPKPASFRKVKYSCELERSLKFDCPADISQFKSSGNIFRGKSKLQPENLPAGPKYGYVSLIDELAPKINEIKIKPDTLKFVSETFHGAELLRFFLADDATEVACNFKHCGGDILVACTTGKPWAITGPVYKPGNRCVKDSDCIHPSHPICDKEYGMCEEEVLPTTVTESTTKSTAMPSTTSTAKPSTTSTAKPSTESTSKPSTTSTAKPSTESTSKPSTTSTAKPSTESTSKPSTTSTAKPSTESTSKPSTTSTAKPSTESTSKPSTKSTSKATPPPQTRCQKDTDCLNADSPVCNTESGLCIPLTCKFDDPALTTDACKDVRRCSEATDNKPEDRHFCQSLVLIAERNTDHSFTVTAFGAAVSETHFLTSVTSEFKKYGNSDLYIIVGGKVHQIRASKLFPGTQLGDPNAKSWQDLVLVKLAASTSFKFGQYFKVNGFHYSHSGRMTSHTMVLRDGKIEMADKQLSTDEECEKIFDGPIKYDKQNRGMACGRDGDDKITRVFNGAPLNDASAVAGQYYLHGIRSIDSLNSEFSDGFLVTKVAANCDWLLAVSKGVVKCV